jgi:hypothetical protein
MSARTPSKEQEATREKGEKPVRSRVSPENAAAKNIDAAHNAAGKENADAATLLKKALGQMLLSVTT